MRWDASRKTWTEFYRVDFPGFGEHERLYCFDDTGRIDESIFSRLRVSGSLGHHDMPDLGNSLIRIRLFIEDEDGEVYSKDVATMLPTTPAKTINQSGESGSVELYSMLYILDAKKTRSFLTIPAGTVAVRYAKAMIESIGLNVIADDSIATLSVDKTYDALTSYLDIINDLMDFAGYSAADVDGRGNVLLRKYTDPSKRSPVMTLRSGDGCVFAPDIAYEFDTFGVPNAYTVVLSSAEGVSTSYTVENHNLDSALSIESRGYVVDDGDTVSDIADDEALFSLAARRLMDASSKVESIEVDHLWMDFDNGDTVIIDYPEAGGRWEMSACSRSIALKHGKCKTRFRRFLNA